MPKFVVMNLIRKIFPYSLNGFKPDPETSITLEIGRDVIGRNPHRIVYVIDHRGVWHQVNNGNHLKRYKEVTDPELIKTINNVCAERIRENKPFVYSK